MRISKLFLAVLLTGAMSFAHSATLAESMDQRSGINDGFFSRHAEGWFWYQDPEPEEEPEPLVLPPPPAPAPAPTEQAKSEDYLPPFSLAWVKKNLEKYLEIAWNDPTPENVQAYFLMQRFAIDRSQKFSDTAQQVVIGNKLLDETMRRPVANFGTKVADSAAVPEINKLLKKISEHAGIFFFFKSDCSYCEVQAPILKQLEKNGFHVMAVSIDGGELRSTQFNDTRIDSGQAQKLGVTATPTMFLMTDKLQFEQLAAGAVSLMDLQNRIFVGALRQGIISEDELNMTKPFFDPGHQTDTSEMLPELLKASAESPSELFSSKQSAQRLSSLESKDWQKLVDKNGFIKPKDLLALAGEQIKTTKSLAELEDLAKDAAQESQAKPISLTIVH